MKNTLFIILLICLSVFSVAQKLRLNELYVKPVDGDPNSEYFELTVDPTHTLSVNTDGYVLFSYYNNGSDSGFYVFDLPARRVAPGDFLLAASARSPFKFQDSTCNPPEKEDSVLAYSWNDSSVASAQAQRFAFKGSWVLSPPDHECNNVFRTVVSDPVTDLTVFLFEKSDDTLEFVDGFIASKAEDRFEAQRYITDLPALRFDMLVGAGKNTVSVDFNTLKGRELGSVPAANFVADEGYYFCSSWDRPVNGQLLTPHAPNTSLQGQPLVASINCKAYMDPVYITITSGQVSPYPIVASLYNDVDNDNHVDINNGDVKLQQKTISTKGKQYVMDKGIGVKNIIVILDAEAKCFDEIAPFDCLLPVRLTSFGAVRHGGNVLLTWETASEYNNMGFYIQRRSGSNDLWDAVTFVATKADEGNSSKAMSYTFTDANTSAGVTQYRLLQVDNNGKASYSPVRSIRGLNQAGNTIVYPNPAGDGVVNVLFDDASALKDVEVTDISGRIIMQWKDVGGNSMQIGNLFPGLYTIRIRDAKTGRQVVERFVVAH